MWRDEGLLLDMLLAARKILRYTDRMPREEFLTNALTQDAVMRNIQIVGEAARKVSPSFKESHPEIPWASMVGMRHRLVHEYTRIVPDKVWGVVELDIPRLIRQIEPLVPPEE